MKKIITIILLFCTIVLNAQELTISGNVQSQKEKEPLISVAIAFYDATTKKIITYAYSDFDGKYKAHFTAIPFYIQADILGFKTYKSEVFKLKKSTTINITMQQSNEILDEVIVTAKKKIIRMRGDKMIVDVASAGIGDGNNGIETLSKLPGMRMDKDENILFRGDGNLQILFNGKPSLLTGNELKQYLKSLNGDVIKSVEIIANPSAKYAASGTGGIINIILKHNTVTGLTGSAFTSFGYAETFKQGNGISLFNNTKKWNINAGIYTNYNESVNHRKVVQVATNTNGVKRLEQKNDWYPIGHSYFAKFGVAYQLSKKATIGGTVQYNLGNSNEKTTGRTDEFFNTNFTKYTLLNTTLKSKSNTITSNVYYSFATDSLTTKIDAQISYANYDNKVTRTTKNQFLDAVTNLNYLPDNDVINKNPTLYQILNSKIDISHKFNDKFSIETGIKHSYVANNYDLILKEKNAQNEYVLDPLRSNKLLYKENITAFYGIGNYQLEKWNFQAGLRVEHINFKATSITDNTTNKGKNTSFFPSLSINRTLEKNQYKLAYSRRIQRPRYLDLNPFFKYVDTYNVEVGNPDLKPQYTNVFDFTWVHNRKTSISIYSKLTTDMIDYIFDYNQNTQITTLYKGNVASATFVGASFNTNFDATKWWTVQLNGDFSFNHLKSDIASNSYDIKSNSFNASIDQKFKLKKDWSFSWNTYYQSAGNYGNVHYFAVYDMSIGVKKYFLHKKLRLNLKAYDILQNSMWHSTITQNNVVTDWVNRSETRRISLSLHYNFGNGKKKRVKNATLQEEERRL